jgi:hypothetical protein
MFILQLAYQLPGVTDWHSQLIYIVIQFYFTHLFSFHHCSFEHLVIRAVDKVLLFLCHLVPSTLSPRHGSNNV